MMQSTTAYSVCRKPHIPKATLGRIENNCSEPRTMLLNPFGFSDCQGRRQWGASGVRPPHLKSVPPYFMFGSPVAAYIQYCIFKMWPPLLVFGPSWFLAPLLLHPGDGPGDCIILNKRGDRLVIVSSHTYLGLCENILEMPAGVELSCLWFFIHYLLVSEWLEAKVQEQANFS